MNSNLFVPPDCFSLGKNGRKVFDDLMIADTCFLNIFHDFWFVLPFTMFFASFHDHNVKALPMMQTSCLSFHFTELLDQTEIFPND